MLQALRREFERRFGAAPLHFARAPGRINLIGEHTDYSGGLALPCAIEPGTTVLAGPERPGPVRVCSLTLGAEAEFDAARPARRGAWSDYVEGAFAVLGEEGHGPAPRDLLIGGDLPLGSGLSSSASLEVALVLALLGAAGAEEVPLARVAELAHRIESAFVGVPCGTLDQRASALCRPGHALRMDFRSGALEPVPLGDGLALLVAHSGVERELAAGAYRERVDECAAALAGAREIFPAARSLRDLSPGSLPALEARLPEKPMRRLRHVVTENARVDAFCGALARGDREEAGALLRAGMASLRDDYGVSTPELDLLCELGDAAPGCFGSRLTGAGFGGCTIHLVEPAAAAAVAARLAAGFEARFGRRPPLLETKAAGGATAGRLR